MLQIIAKIFGNKSIRDIKRLTPLVEQAKKDGEELKSHSNDDLRDETVKIQDQINSALRDIDDQLAALHRKVADNPELDLNEKESIFAEVDALELERNKELEKVLLKVGS